MLLDFSRTLIPHFQIGINSVINMQLTVGKRFKLALLYNVLIDNKFNGYGMSHMYIYTSIVYNIIKIRFVCNIFIGISAYIIMDQVKKSLLEYFYPENFTIDYVYPN